MTVNVTKPNVTESNVTQSNTTVPPPMTSISPNRTLPALNASCTSSPVRQPVTSAVPFLPSSTVAKTVNNDQHQSRTSTVSYLNYSTSIMGLQSSAPFQLSTAGSLLILFLHLRGKMINAPARTNENSNNYLVSVIG